MTHQPTYLSGRRQFLLGATTAAGALLAACSSSGDSATATTPTTGAPETTPPTTAATPATTAVPPTTTPTTAPPPLPSWRPNGNPYLAENFAPVADELTVTTLKVQGTIPAALRGSFLRNGPNPMTVADPTHWPWFPGDGMIHGLQLRDGQAVAYRNRWVRTTTVATALGEPAVPGPTPVGFDGSNTNVVPFRGQILSVTEGALPYVVTADLDTVSRIDFPGGLSHGLSAHCKYDPATGELHNISYRIGPAPYAVWNVIDRDGNVTRSVPIELDVCGMWHTFSLTDNYVIVYDHAVVYNAERLADGWLFPFAWDPSHRSRVGLIERAGDGSVRWIDAPLGSVNHDIAAHDTPNGVTVYFTSSERQFDRDKAGPLEAPPSLVRLDLDTTAGTSRLTTFDDHAQEFPRAHPDLGLHEARYIYAIGGGPVASGGGVIEPGNAIIKHDLQQGTTEVASMGRARATAEAVFVADPDREADEDGGWLLSYVYDATTDLSDFVITDAQDIAGGPVATVSLGARVPFGFHGNWITID